MAAFVIAVACIVFMLAMLVLLVLDVRRERKPRPVAHVESGTNHMRRG